MHAYRHPSTFSVVLEQQGTSNPKENEGKRKQKEKKPHEDSNPACRAAKREKQQPPTKPAPREAHKKQGSTVVVSFFLEKR
jgi:hypothetical protein